MVDRTRTDESGGSARSLRRWTAAAIVASLVVAGFVTLQVVRGRQQEQRRQEVVDAVTGFATALHRDPAEAARRLCRAERSAYAAQVPRDLVLPAQPAKTALAVSDVRRSGSAASVRVVPRGIRALATRVTLTREGGRWRVCDGAATAVTGAGAASSDGAVSSGGLCDGARRDVSDARSAIRSHNAAPHVFRLPAEQAELDAYQARARALDRRFSAAADRLVACRRAQLTLVGPDTGATLRAPSAAALSALEDAGSDRQALAHALAAGAPSSYGDVALQGRARPGVGDADPAFAGGRVLRGADGSPTVLSTPVVPLGQLVDVEGFTRLTPRMMYAVAFSPVDQQWTSTYAAAATSSRSMAKVLGLAPSYTRRQEQQASVVTSTLERAVGLLVESRG